MISTQYNKHKVGSPTDWLFKVLSGYYNRIANLKMRIDSSNLFALSQALPTYNLLMSRILSLRYIKINADYFFKTHLEQPED